MSTKHRRTVDRSGVSLIETLVIVSAASTILTLTGLLVHRTMQVSSRAQVFHQDEASAWRLSAQLRTDAIGFRDAEVDGSRLMFRAQDGTNVTYDFSHLSVQRSVSDDAQSVSRNTYVFRTASGWTLVEAEEPRRLIVHATPSGDLGTKRGPAPLRLRVTIPLPGMPTSVEASP